MKSAITIDNIGKTFKVPHERRDTLKESLLGIGRRRTYEDFNVLKDVNIEVNSGDFVGIVGKNGSGKSTLLKLIAGIYRPTNGSVSVHGRIAPFLELGVGFQPELSARENIIVNGTLLGLTRKQIKEKFAEIVKFAEIENFLDLKIKNYSSGMKARLAFAIAKEADADIYLCDEVLAVGDESFQKKCLEVFDAWKKAGKTIILVSHNASQIEQLCSRAMLLDGGSVAMEGSPVEVIAEYHRRMAAAGRDL
ncbi:ABC transporter ATP-binding protein [Patescibacteria group bacterium]|nr:ABC transporter ATP-binding protein [Patescibacteria group bacterium]MBU1702954.1 ABC transporter ATP-binding protein [Patescibacteria group bacterium]MBU1953962.1 ABC transporter ATP-binding protein [Patescibacteria group bacterium]